MRYCIGIANQRYRKVLRVPGIVLLAALVLPTLAGQTAAVENTTPAAVFLMRHAEKPDGEKSPDLTETGFARARVLPTLFVPAPGGGPARFPRPDAIFATAPSKHSNRPIETITPLAQALHLKINEDYTDPETGPIAKKVLSGAYAGKVVVIAWHHGELPHLAEAFGVTDVPQHWDPNVFDLIWEIRWVDGKPVMLQLPERLLPGDAK
jgi:hypothetical protein